MNFIHSRLVKAAIFIIAFLFILTKSIYAQEKHEAVQIYLNSGDKISGECLDENDDQIIVLSQECLSPVTVKKSAIKKMKKSSPAKVPEQSSPSQDTAESKVSFVPKNREQDVILLEKEVSQAKEVQRREWERRIALGYTKATGNTQSGMASARVSLDGKTEEDQYTFKADYYYSSANNKMDGQKWDGLGRYSFNFGASNRYYNYYKVLADHDRFANIQYRAVGTTGLGYKFSDTDDFKLFTEAGAGLEYTQFRDNTKRRYEAVLTPRIFFEKKIFWNARISSDVSLYPSLSKRWNYRLHSETALVSPLSDEFSLRISYIHDYLSNPGFNSKKSDVMIVSALEYSF
ncbi:MAG: DUF481 domain-containing protein [Candidatus Omnitrophota bacterium]